jgi:apolipoprotein N-acyltransferase
MITLRAIENRTYIVRAANTGISAIIAPTGEVLKQTNLFERTTLRGTIKWMTGRTFYSQYGDVFAYGCFAVMIIFVSIAYIRRVKK